MLQFLLGLMLGGFIGIFIICLMQANRRADGDDRTEQ